jgi:hypothetical protein
MEKTRLWERVTGHLESSLGKEFSRSLIVGDHQPPDAMQNPSQSQSESAAQLTQRLIVDPDCLILIV